MKKAQLFSGLVGAGLVLTLLHPAAVALSVDNFSVVKNGALLFNDPFSDGVPPPNAPNFANGTPASYSVLGTLDEAGGKVNLDTAGAATTPGIGGPGLFFIERGLLLTNIDPTNLALGLKNNSTFSVTGVFDLVVPRPNQEYYGVRFADFATNVQGNDLLDLAVRRGGDGIARVQFFRLDQIADTFTSIAAVPLAPGHDQISLTLARTTLANDEITASFFYIDGGVPGPTTTFMATSDIFNGENWTRAEFHFVTPAPVVEPSTLIFLGVGLAGLTGVAWRRHGR